MLACHGVYDAAQDRFYAEHDEDRPIYEAQLAYALSHVRWRAEAAPWLIISGGMTKAQPYSESRSYLDLALKLGLKLPERLACEEYSLTSIENVLFSLFVFLQLTGAFPETIEVISWEFKRLRFERTLEALNRWTPLGQTWPSLSFFPVGDLWGPAKAAALEVERDYIESLEQGIEAYYRNERIQAVLRRRDLHQARIRARQLFADYPLPF